MKNSNRIIMGSALGLATIAVAIDHTRHRLPVPEPVIMSDPAELIEDDDMSSPCSMSYEDDVESSPCGLGD